MGKIIVSRMNETEYYSMHYIQNLCSNSFVVTMACSEYFLDQACSNYSSQPVYISNSDTILCM